MNNIQTFNNSTIITKSIKDIPEVEHQWSSEEFVKKCRHHFLDRDAKIGFYSEGGGIGDNIVFTNLPENFYYCYGKKIYNVGSSIFYKYNKFTQLSLERMACDFIIETYMQRLYFSDGWVSIPRDPNIQRKSLTNQIYHSLGIKEFVRHPCLYKGEDSVQKINQVVIHPYGKSCGNLPNNILRIIIQKYQNWNIVWIGKKSEGEIIPTKNFLDARDLDFWDTAKVISESAVFIGGNSGFMHVANAYHNIRKKIILHYNNEDEVSNFIPLGNVASQAIWADFGFEYYNRFNHDIGITKTFLKI